LKWGIKEQNKISNMSAASTITKQSSIKAPKMTRKERRQLKEVETLRERTTPILPATTFKRIVTQTASQFSPNRLRFNADAVLALQAATEQELTTIFTGAAFCAQLGKRDTMTVEDMRNFQLLRNLH
jgi:histone H3/H4